MNFLIKNKNTITFVPFLMTTGVSVTCLPPIDTSVSFCCANACDRRHKKSRDKTVGFIPAKITS